MNEDIYSISTNEIKCIFCGLNADDGEEHQLSNEHVIPRVLGGWLTIRFVCVSCNNDRFGAQFEAELKNNALIVTALDKLGLQSKSLAYKSAQITFSIESGKSLIGYFDKTGEARHFPQEIEDGSMIVPEDETKMVLQKMIERYERDTGKKIIFDLENISKLPFDKFIPIYGTNLSFIKRRNQRSSITISGLEKPISFMVPAKIVFEHFAALFYPYIMRNEFDSIRNWLYRGDSNVNPHVLLHHPLYVKDPTNLTYRPFHYVRFRYRDKCLSAIVCLFGTITFSVYLAHISDFSTYPFPEVIDTYHIYDIKQCQLYQNEVSARIRYEDDRYLDVVCLYGRTQSRGK